MTRYAPTLGSQIHCSQSLSILWTSSLCWPQAGSSPISPGLHRRPTWQLETEDWLSKTILAENHGGWPATWKMLINVFTSMVVINISNQFVNKKVFMCKSCWWRGRGQLSRLVTKWGSYLRGECPTFRNLTNTKHTSALSINNFRIFL